MKIISLTQGKEAIVDDEDFERVNQKNWCFCKGYAVRGMRSRKEQWQKTIHMHRFILESPKNKEVDHINGNGLDNRKVNLRLCSRSENNMNRRKQNNNTSGFKGVTWNKHANKWRAYIKINGKQIHLGLYEEKIKAAEVYDIASKKYHGSFSKPNYVR